MKKNESLKAGLFIVIATSLFALIIFVMGSEKQIFASQEEYVTTFTDVKGLASGAPVRLAGITIGRISEIGFSKDVLDNRVHIKFAINKSYLDRMHTDSSVTIETQGLLGDRFLNIVPGSEEGVLAPGSTIVSKETGDMAEILAKAGQVVDNTVQISNSVNEFISVLSKDTINKVTDLAGSAANLSREIEKGEGFLHKLIYSKKDGDKIITGLSKASEDLSSLMGEVKSGKGFLHALIYDEKGSKSVESLASAAESISTLASSFSEITAEIKHGNGLANQIIYGDSPDGLDDVIRKLNVTAENLKKASEALSQGSGTLGSLLVDSKLYDNLVEVTDGAKRSILLRQAIRSSLDK